MRLVIIPLLGLGALAACEPYPGGGYAGTSYGYPAATSQPGYYGGGYAPGYAPGAVYAPGPAYVAPSETVIVSDPYRDDRYRYRQDRYREQRYREQQRDERRAYQNQRDDRRAYENQRFEAPRQPPQPRGPAPIDPIRRDNVGAPPPRAAAPVFAPTPPPPPNPHRLPGESPFPQTVTDPGRG